MSIKTAAAHTAAELTFVCLDESGEIAYFQSASKSNPSKPNVTAYDIDTDATFCFCKGFEVRGDCWHVSHCAASWRTVAHQVRCARMTPAELLAHGQSLVKYVLEADAAGQTWIAANLRVQLDEARIAWKAQRAERAALVALTTPTGKLLGCPDCGELTRNPYLCSACVNDTMAARAGIAA